MHRRTYVAAALAALAAWAAAPAQPVRPPEKPVADVNGVKISPAELDAVIRAAGPEPVQLPAAQRRQRQVEALALLIDNVLMRQFLDRTTPPLAAADVDRRLEEIRTGLRAQNKSLAEFCRDTGQTEEHFKVGIADHLRWTAYVAGQINDAAVERYYRDNLDFFDNVTVTASHLVLRVPPSATEREKAEAKEKLRAWRKELVEFAGDADARARNFAEVARKRSQDARAAQGGELGTFPRRWVFDEAFSKAAFALKEGEISDVVETEFGYHLILVTKRSEGTRSDFARIKEVVREFCAEDLRQSILARERKAGKIEIDLP
jgi:peptidyl-prolyl cis-trans isomerase C